MVIHRITRRIIVGLGVLVAAFMPVSVSAAGTDKPAEKPSAATDASKETPPELPALKAVPVADIDLASALRMAGVQNPQILFARERTLEAVAERQLAAAQLLPTLRAGTNIDLHMGPVQQSSGNILKITRGALYLGAGAGAVAAGTVPLPGVSYNVNVTENIYGFLIRRQLVNQQQFLSRAAENDVLGRVAVAYTRLLRAAGRRAIALQTRDDAREVTRLMEAYVKTGLGKKSDLERAATFLRDRDTDLVEAQGEMLTASARLVELLNLDPAVRLQPLEDHVTPVSIVPDPIPLCELLAIALLQRPELAAQRAAVEQALLALRAAKLLPFSPTILFGYSAGTFGGGGNPPPSATAARFGEFGSREDLDVLGYWTLQNMGIGNIALIRAARSRLSAADLERLVILNRVREEVASAYVDTHVRFSQIAVQERAIQAGGRAFLEDMTRIKGGVGLPLELLDSLRLLGQARFDYIDAIAGYNQAHFMLYVALGQPPADMLARPVPNVRDQGSGSRGQN